jgi:hypothetical protein
MIDSGAVYMCAISCLICMQIAVAISCPHCEATANTKSRTKSHSPAICMQIAYEIACVNRPLECAVCTVGNGSGRSLTGAGAGQGCRPTPPLRVYMLSYIRCPRRGTWEHYKYKEPQPNSCPRLFVSRRLCHRPPSYLSSTWSTPTRRLYPVGTVIRDVLRSILLDPVLCECDLSGGPGVGQPQDD